MYVMELAREVAGLARSRQWDEFSLRLGFHCPDESKGELVIRVDVAWALILWAVWGD